MDIPNGFGFMTQDQTENAQIKQSAKRKKLDMVQLTYQISLLFDIRILKAFQCIILQIKAYNWWFNLSI